MEVIDLYDDDGNKLDKTYVRGDKYHKFDKGEHIPIVMFFLENSNGEFLVQKTSEIKGSIFGMTGGHIDKDEERDNALVREVKEEIGLDVDMNEVKYLGHIITGVPIRFLYYLKKDIDLSKLVLDEEEVDSVRFMEVNEILNLIEEELFIESHGICFNKILEMKDKKEI